MPGLPLRTDPGNLGGACPVAVDRPSERATPRRAGGRLLPIDDRARWSHNMSWGHFRPPGHSCRPAGAFYTPSEQRTREDRLLHTAGSRRGGLGLAALHCGRPRGGHRHGYGGFDPGNAVQRLEDPTLLTGAGSTSTTSSSRDAARRVRPVDVAHGECRRRYLRGGGDARRRRRCTHADGDDLGLAPFQGFPMMPAELNRPIFAKDTGALRRRHRRRGRGRDPRARPSTPPSGDRRLRRRCRWSRRAAGAWRPTPRSCSPSTAPTSASAPTFGDDVDPLEGADAVAEVTMVSQRLAGVPMEMQRHPRRARRADGSVTCWVSHQAPHSATPRSRRCSASSPSSCASSARGSAAASARRPPSYVEYLVAAAAALALGAR